MRPVKAGKHILSKLVIAVLLLSLSAPPFAHACGCLCASVELARAADSRAADNNALPGKCCQAGNCGRELFTGIFPAGIGLDLSGRAALPVCCRETCPVKKSTVQAALLPDDSRPTFNQLRDQAAGPSTFLPGCLPIRASACFAFHKNMNPTSPHITSTILLL